MLAASIIIITVYIVMGVLYWQLGYLGMAIFFVVFYWGPNKDVLRDKRAHGRQYEYQKEYNNLNPLYERGLIGREKRNTDFFLF